MPFADVWFAWCWPHLLRLLWLSFVLLTGAELAAGLEISARVPGCSADYADSERSNRIKQQLQKENLKMWGCRRLVSQEVLFLYYDLTFTLHISPDLIRLPFSIFFLLNLVPNLDVRLEEHQWTCIALRKHSQTKCWYLLMVVFQTFWYILYAVLFRQSHPSCQYFNIFQYVVLYISNLPRMLSVLETSVESMLTMHQCIANKMFSRGRKAVTQTSAWDQRPSVKGGQPRSCFGWKRTNHFFSQSDSSQEWTDILNFTFQEVCAMSRQLHTSSPLILCRPEPIFEDVWRIV